MFYCCMCRMPLARERIAICADCARLCANCGTARDDIGRCPSCAGAASPRYGFFEGGDPRDFHPDLELASAEELARHAAACSRAETDAAWRHLSPGNEFGPGVNS